MLSQELEDSLWDQVLTQKLSVTKLEPPSVLEVKTKIPANKKKWYFDDSDDELEEEKRNEIKERSPEARQEAARSIGRSLLSDTWGAGGTYGDQCDDDDIDDDDHVHGRVINRRSSTGSSQSRRRATSPPLLREDEEEDVHEVNKKTPDEDSTFTHAVDDMFNATMVQEHVYTVCVCKTSNDFLI